MHNLRIIFISISNPIISHFLIGQKFQHRGNPRSPVNANDFYQTVYRRTASIGSLIDAAGYQTKAEVRFEVGKHGAVFRDFNTRHRNG